MKVYSIIVSFGKRLIIDCIKARNTQQAYMIARRMYPSATIEIC